MVGAARFELATPSPPDWCANQAAPRSEMQGQAVALSRHSCGGKWEVSRLRSTHSVRPENPLAARGVSREYSKPQALARGPEPRLHLQQFSQQQLELHPIGFAQAALLRRAGFLPSLADRQNRRAVARRLAAIGTIAGSTPAAGRRVGPPELRHVFRALLPQQLLHTLDRVAVGIEQRADAAQQVNVIRSVVPATACPLHR